MSTHPTSSSLLIDLAGVARLAGVRRPVASMWRARFTSSADPFPSAVAANGDRALFDALSVARWLERTEHGNNPEAAADAAASATPANFAVADASHVAELDALLALRTASGRPLGDRTPDDLRRSALVVDPDDLCLASEVTAAPPHWAAWADLLADAAYSPLEASRALERRHAATRSADGSTGPFTANAEALLAALAEALTIDNLAQLVLSAGFSPSLASELLSRVGDAVELVIPPVDAGRGIRRRLLCEGVAQPLDSPSGAVPRLLVERLASHAATTVPDMLRSIDELVLTMNDADRAIVIGPAGVLTNAMAPADGLARTDLLRSGRIRAITKLPAGLVTAAPREALALWVLGRETGEVAVADRFTAVADLTDAALTAGTRTDLTSDVLAAMGSARDIRAHAFRFTRLVRTTSLLAARGPLVTGGRPSRASAPRIRDLPALLDQARAHLAADAPAVSPSAIAGAAVAVEPAQVEALIAERHLRLVPGTRLETAELGATGLVVVHADDLEDPTRIGNRRVDPLAFADQHPSARLTAPGDVVFRTSPSPRAWVDPDGSKVVVHPARVLRIDSADPAGLVPELIAADVNRATGGAGSWRRWTLRRVAPRVSAPLRSALADLAMRRDELARRIEALDAYSELLTAGVVAGVISLPEHAADAAFDSS